MGTCRYTLRLSFPVISILVFFGCASFQPRPMEEVSFKDRAQTQQEGDVRVTAAVLSAEESEAIFGVPLYKKGIQPIWLEIENNEEEPVWFLPVGLDPDYFAPLEVTYLYHRAFSKKANDQMDQYFQIHAMQQFIAPGTTRSGFIFTNLDLGTKSFNVDLVGEDSRVRTFTFFISVPGLRVDHHDIEFDKLYSANEIVAYDHQGFRKAIEKMPCCTTNQEGLEQVAPVNIVIIGNGEDRLQVLIRSGWNETATAKKASSPKQQTNPDIQQSLRYAPVKPMFFYGRSQDASFRKDRVSGHARNHLRLWLSPMRLDGKEVWVGHIGSDLKKRSASKKAYRIDLDEVRDFFLQDIWYSQGLVKYGYVKGVGASSFSEPRQAFKDVIYLTDGLRGVLWVSGEPLSLSEVEYIEWDTPPER